MTIVILFHQSHYRDFKAFYEKYVQQHLSAEFPKLVSYKRFVALKQGVGIPLYVPSLAKTLFGKLFGDKGLPMLLVNRFERCLAHS